MSDANSCCCWQLSSIPWTLHQRIVYSPSIQANMWLKRMYRWRRLVLRFWTDDAQILLHPDSVEPSAIRTVLRLGRLGFLCLCEGLFRATMSLERASIPNSLKLTFDIPFQPVFGASDFGHTAFRDLTFGLRFNQTFRGHTPCDPFTSGWISFWTLTCPTYPHTSPCIHIHTHTYTIICILVYPACQKGRLHSHQAGLEHWDAWERWKGNHSWNMNICYIYIYMYTCG